MNRRGFLGGLGALAAGVFLPKAPPFPPMPEPEAAPPFPVVPAAAEKVGFYGDVPVSFGTTSVSMLEADLWPAQALGLQVRPLVIRCAYCGGARKADDRTCPGCGAR